MPRLAALPLTVALLLLLPACGEERIERDAFVHRQPLAAGAWLHIRNGAGSIRVTRAAGDSATVTASRRVRGSRPDEVHFTVSRRGAETIVCAVGSTARCDTDHRVDVGPSLGSRLRALVRGSIAVDFVVAVPAGVRVDARQHTGDIIVEGLGADVVAQAHRGEVVTVEARNGEVPRAERPAAR